MRQRAFRILYIDDSSESSAGIVLTIDGDNVVVPLKGDAITVNESTFIVEYITHSFLDGSPTHVIEVHVINHFEYCMREG